VNAGLVYPELRGKQILVTGGSGFIGGRLVEKLILDCHAQVRVLMRNIARSPRVARFSVELVEGDVTDPISIQRAVSGCEIVFHCAYGNSGDQATRRRINVEGTKNILDASLRSGVKRLVHVSTLMVYSIKDGDLDETAPRRYSGHTYADSKLEAEEQVISYVKKYGLPASIVQPCTVYGPFAPYWTAALLKGIQTGRLILVNGGSGLCNAVYVDDVVHAMLLAATKDGAVGEAFLISASQPVTWKEFYGSYERMLGLTGTVDLSIAEAESHYLKKQALPSVLAEMKHVFVDNESLRERILNTREIRAMINTANAVIPEKIWKLLKSRLLSSRNQNSVENRAEGQKPIHAIDPTMVRFCAAKTYVRIDKARRMLGYEPGFDLKSGMNLTEQWARWADLLGDTSSRHSASGAQSSV